MSFIPQRRRKVIPYPLPEYMVAPDDYQEKEPQPIPVDISPRERGGFRTTGVLDSNGQLSVEREPFVPPALTLATMAQAGQYPLEIGPNPARMVDAPQARVQQTKEEDE